MLHQQHYLRDHNVNNQLIALVLGADAPIKQWKKTWFFWFPRHLVNLEAVLFYVDQMQLITI